MALVRREAKSETSVNELHKGAEQFIDAQSEDSGCLLDQH
jgi:hypothetical protein